MRSIVFGALFAALALALPLAAQEGDKPAPAPEKKAEPVRSVVIVKTSMGEFEVELFDEQAPETVKNFIGLAEGTKPFIDPKDKKEVKRPYYDGIAFHRIIDNFMIQGGDPLGNGQGGPGYAFKDEINAKALGLDKEKAVTPEGQPHPGLPLQSQRDFQRLVVNPILKEFGITTQEQIDANREALEKRMKEFTVYEALVAAGYKYDEKLKSTKPLRGTLAMANSGPNTNGSQFFINTVDNVYLSGRHTVFGRVTKGMDVVDKLGKVKVDPRTNKPVETVKIISIRLKPRG
ncbi:MAG: peptidylprolyl isomerase [Planctomycetota bacterium]